VVIVRTVYVDRWIVPPRPMCIADWACDPGYECDLDRFECVFALE
jgi:hypothetical protein